MAYNQGGYLPGQPMQQVGPNGWSKPDDEIVMGIPISQTPPQIRSDFVRKVYSILTVQLTVTFCIAFYMNTQLDKLWVKQHAAVLYMPVIGTLALMLGVRCCCPETLRTFPINYVILGALTLGISVTTGCVTTLYTTDSVLLALATTAGVFLVLTAYACVTKTDFTGCGPFLFAGAMSMMMFGLVTTLFSFATGVPLASDMLHKVYAGFGVVLFSCYIVYDTQLIVGGTHRSQFSIDDYVAAALELYLDVINLFQYVLELMGTRDE